MKALECVLYLAAKLPRPTLHSISKILYFADKRHLWKYGCLICGDRYVAMEYGPVPSAIYDMMKAIRDAVPGRRGQAALMRKAKRFLNVTKYRIKPLREADIMELSESNEECMDWAIEKYGHCSFDELTKLSHDETWRKAKKNSLIPVELMTLGAQNREALLEYLKDPFPGTAECR